MAKIVLTSAKTQINAVDYSAFISKVEFDYKYEDKDVTTFGSGGVHERIAGLGDGNVNITFKNDYAVGVLDGNIWALLGTVTAFKVKATSAANSTSNPEYQFSVLVLEWKPIAGTVGDVAEVDVSWPITAAVVRATS